MPDANLGIVMSASRTRRQMIQRMGRILRRKRAGVAARFLIMFAKDTLEDPANRVERDGFLDEIERISEAAGVFDSAHFDEVDAFLAGPGPEVVPEPEHLESYWSAAAAAGARLRCRSRRRDDRITRRNLGRRDRVRAARASPAGITPRPRHAAAMRRLDARLPQPDRGDAVPRARARDPAVRQQAESRTEALVDRTRAARDRPHRFRVADQLHRLRRSVARSPVPVAGARANGALPLHLSAACQSDDAPNVSQSSSRPPL